MPAGEKGLWMRTEQVSVRREGLQAALSPSWEGFVSWPVHGGEQPRTRRDFSGLWSPLCGCSSQAASVATLLGKQAESDGILD